VGGHATQVYLDVTVDGAPAGRVVVKLFGDVAVGAQRFADLAQGKEGVGFRRSKFDALTEVRMRVWWPGRRRTCVYYANRVRHAAATHLKHVSQTRQSPKRSGVSSVR
jgi:hypothetical protein